MDDGNENEDGRKKKNAAFKRCVLIAVVVFVGVTLVAALPLIVIARGCGWVS